MSETNVGKAVAIAAPTIALIIVSLFVISFVVSFLLGLPPSLGLPLPLRFLGGAMVVAGLAVAGWVFRYRRPADMIVSTYVTFTKLFRRAPLAEISDRTESLVISGPQRYVRNPLYFGVIVIVFGWALFGGTSYVLVAAIVLLLWFCFVLIPFEERELRALFGDHYARYMESVPMLIPFTKRARRSGAEQDPAGSPKT
jgi:protein-S-isoprenylcysteine O-methyltransferase Ste14